MVGVATAFGDCILLHTFPQSYLPTVCARMVGPHLPMQSPSPERGTGAGMHRIVLGGIVVGLGLGLGLGCVVPRDVTWHRSFTPTMPATAVGNPLAGMWKFLNCPYQTR